MLIDNYFLLMLVGYLISIAVEMPVLVALLSRRHPIRARVFAGVWLTACTYPVVWLVLPPLLEGYSRSVYLLVAETFAPVAECALFWFAFVRPLADPEPTADEEEWPFAVPEPPERGATARDLAVITLANLCSFGVGEVLSAAGLFGGG